MRSRVLALGLALTSLTPALAADLSSRDFAFGMRVRIAQPAAVYRAPLPLDVYRRTVRPDLADVRVFNGRDEVVPYALRRPPAETLVRHAPTRLPTFPLRGDPGRALEALRVTIDSGRAAVDVQTRGSAAGPGSVGGYILDGRALELPVAALVLDWPDDAGEFAGRLSVEASEDLGAWRQIAAGAPVANLRADGERLVERRIEFPATRARFWRLTWAGPAAPFVLTGASAEPAERRLEVPRARLVVGGRRNDAAGGELSFDLGARVPVDRINVELPEANSVVQLEVLSRASPEDEWTPVARHGFYRLSSAHGELRNGPLVVPETTHRYWLLRADGAGGEPGPGALRLAAAWVPHELLFVARGEGPFLLAYGSGAARPAQASLESILPRDVQVSDAQLAPPTVLGGADRLAPPPRGFPWRTALLWLVLLAGVLGVGWMAYRLFRELGRAKPGA